MPPGSPNPGGRWRLEVVRGAHVGRSYPIEAGESTVGTASDPSVRINLADQEGTSPRRMAGRQASIASTGPSATIRDLDSPGGTFVNGRRVLPGQSLPLDPGDLIQLGAVQLRVAVEAAPPAPAGAPSPADPPPSTPRGFPYRSTAGTTCRSWDDLATLSAQDWDGLRDDWGSGCLDDLVRREGRPDLAAPASARAAHGPEADGLFDAWLGRLPLSRPARPELEVSPGVVKVRVASGGVSARRSFRVVNVGLRLLRSEVRVDPDSARWLRVDPAFAARPIVTRDATEVGFEVDVPAVLDAPLAAEIRVDSDGGSATVRVEVEIRPGAPAGPVASGPATADGLEPASRVGERLAAWRAIPVGRRVVGGVLVGVATRLAVGVLGGSIGADEWTPSGPETPGLIGVAAALGALGAGLGAWAGPRGGRLVDSAAAVVTGASLGVGLAAVLVAACRSVEPILGAMGGGLVGPLVLWALIGGLVAAWPVGRGDLPREANP